MGIEGEKEEEGVREVKEGREAPDPPPPPEGSFVRGRRSTNTELYITRSSSLRGGR